MNNIKINYIRVTSFARNARLFCSVLLFIEDRVDTGSDKRTPLNIYTVNYFADTLTY